MDTTEITNLIGAAQEDETVELKRALPRGRRHLRTLGAFANGAGGTLIVGVSDAGVVIGVRDPNAVRETLEHELRHHVRPKPPAHVALVPAPPPARGSLVVVRVQPGREGPYAVRLPDGQWQCYVRERDRTVPLPDEVVGRATNPDRAGLPTDPKGAEILRLLANARALTRVELTAALNLSPRRLDRLLVSLVRAGLAVEHTESKESRYVLTPQGRKLAQRSRGR